MGIRQLTFEHGGHTYQCRIASSGVSRMSGPAVPGNELWLIAVDGMWHLGFRAKADDSAESVKRRVIEWHQARRLATAGRGS